MNIRVVEDKELVQSIRNKIKQNDGYCPCKLEKIPENRCICKEFVDMETEGTCHCGLYKKVLEDK